MGLVAHVPRGIEAGWALGGCTWAVLRNGDHNEYAAPCTCLSLPVRARREWGACLGAVAGRAPGGNSGRPQRAQVGIHRHCSATRVAGVPILPPIN
eukprot:scaffold31574_cov124-Isochrysis_galbana.AAC.1